MACKIDVGVSVTHKRVTMRIADDPGIRITTLMLLPEQARELIEQLQHALTSFPPPEKDSSSPPPR